jgi:hypothetical protein
VRHLPEGVLRRLYDEPYSLDEAGRAHYWGCAVCQQRFSAIAEDARTALAAMAVPAAPIDPLAALRRLQARPAPPPRRLPLPSRFGLRQRKPVLAGAATGMVAVAAAATLAFSPAGAAVVHIFQPSQVSTVTVQTSDLQGLDAFSTWGTVHWTDRPQLQQADSLAQAAQISGLPEVQVGTVPAAYASAPVSYAAMGRGMGTVTFTDKAPSQLQGSTLSVQTGPAEVVVYGDLSKLMQGARGAQSQQQAENAIVQAGGVLGIVVMRAPRVTSTGVSVDQIKQVLLAQPLSPSLRKAVEAIDSPAGNLPIPIPAGQLNSSTVTVQGVTGQAYGDNTGLGSGVVWIKSGYLYAVVGTIPQDEALAIAQSVR